MRSVRTAFQVLEAVGSNQPIGLSELARRLGLPKSTVQRSLVTLADLGWIRSDGRDFARWALGERVRTLSDQVDDLGPLRDVALPVLSELNRETQETVHLAVPDNGTMRLIERQDSPLPLRWVRPIGTRSPLHAGSTGKSVLALLPENEVEAYLEAGLTAVTSRTITDPEGLRAELKAIRERGYAIADEEVSEGVVSVAACVRPEGRRPVAAISVSAPASRMAPETRAGYGQKVMAAAAEVAAQLRG